MLRAGPRRRGKANVARERVTPSLWRRRARQRSFYTRLVCQVCHSVVSEMPQLKKVSLLKMLTTV